jgi:hypothetical protein
MTAVYMNFEAFYLLGATRHQTRIACFYDDLHEEFNIPFRTASLTRSGALNEVIAYLKTRLPTVAELNGLLAGDVVLHEDEGHTLYLLGLAEVECKGDGYVFGENDGRRHIFNQIEDYAGRNAVSLETLALQLRTFYPVFAQEDWSLLATLEHDLAKRKLKPRYRACNPALRKQLGWKRVTQPKPQ